MADSNDDIDAMLHPPPPPPGINDAPTPNALAPSIGPRQICPAEGVGLVLTPPRELETRRLICGSAVSSLTTRTSSTNTLTENAEVTASAAHTMTPLSGSKRPALDLAPDCSSPSPSKNYPDYSITKSSGDSVASGDDSLQWEIEGDRILAAQTSKMHEEEVDADAELQQENAIAELEEFMLCGGGREDEDEVVGVIVAPQGFMAVGVGDGDGAVVGRVGGAVAPAVPRAQPAPREGGVWGGQAIGAQERGADWPEAERGLSVAFAFAGGGAEAAFAEAGSVGFAERADRAGGRVGAEDRHSMCPCRSRLVAR